MRQNKVYETHRQKRQNPQASFVFPQISKSRGIQQLQPQQNVFASETVDRQFPLLDRSTNHDTRASMSTRVLQASNPSMQEETDASCLADSSFTRVAEPAPSSIIKTKAGSAKATVGYSANRARGDTIVSNLADKYDRVMQSVVSKAYDIEPGTDAQLNFAPTAPLSSSSLQPAQREKKTAPQPAQVKPSELQITFDADLSTKVDALPSLKECMDATALANVENDRLSWTGYMFPDFQYCELHKRLVPNSILLPESEEANNNTAFCACGVCLKKDCVDMYGIELARFFKKKVDPLAIPSLRAAWLECGRGARLLTSNPKADDMQVKRAAVAERNAWLDYMAAVYRLGLYQRVNIAYIHQHRGVVNPNAFDKLDERRDPLLRYFHDCRNRMGEAGASEVNNYICQQYCPDHKEYGDFVPRSMSSLYKECGICLNYKSAAPRPKARDAVRVADMQLSPADLKKYSGK